MALSYRVATIFVLLIALAVGMTQVDTRAASADDGVKYQYFDDDLPAGDSGGPWFPIPPELEWICATGVFECRDCDDISCQYQTLNEVVARAPDNAEFEWPEWNFKLVCNNESWPVDHTCEYVEVSLSDCYSNYVVCDLKSYECLHLGQGCPPPSRRP